MKILLTFLLCQLMVGAQLSQDFNSQCPYLNCPYGKMPTNPCQCLMPNQLNQQGYMGNNPCATMTCGVGQRCAVTQVGATCVSISVNGVGGMGGIGGMGGMGRIGGIGGMGGMGGMGNMGSMGNRVWGGMPRVPYPSGYIRRPMTPYNPMPFGRQGNYGPNFGRGMNQPFPGQMPNNMISGPMMPNNNRFPGPLPVPMACTQTLEKGRCSAIYTRYYFDRLSGQCQTFRYSGCGGNNNNFATFSECQQLCVVPPTFRLRP